MSSLRSLLRSVLVCAAVGASGLYASESKNPPAGGEEESTLLTLLAEGGPVMYPIYACSVVACAFALERFLSLRRKRVVPPAFLTQLCAMTERRPLDPGAVLAFCEAHDNPPARLMAAALKRFHRSPAEIEKSIEDAGFREARRLRRNTRVLMGIASVTPLLGLLGTVLGMIEAFRRLELARGAAARAAETLAPGIYQALVSTAAGLTVAIPSLVLYLLFNARVERLIMELDETALGFVERISRRKEQVPSWEERP